MPVLNSGRLGLLASVRCAALTLVALAASCTYPATQILFEVDTNLPRLDPVTREFLRLRIVVPNANGDARFEQSLPAGAGPVQLPGTFGVRPGMDIGETLRVQIEASLGTRTLTRWVDVHFVRRESRRVVVFMNARCAEPGPACAQGMTWDAWCRSQGLTCGNDGACVAPAVDPVPLPIDLENDFRSFADAAAVGFDCGDTNTQPPFPEGQYGSRCETRAECSGLGDASVCLAYPNGFCATAGTCLPFASSGCAEGALCAAVATSATSFVPYCMRECAFDPSNPEAPCRTDSQAQYICRPWSGRRGICVPRCANDSECAGWPGGAFHCDPAAHVCGHGRGLARPLGSACTAASDCEGSLSECYRFVGGSNACSLRCLPDLTSGGYSCPAGTACRDANALIFPAGATPVFLCLRACATVADCPAAGGTVTCDHGFCGG